MEAQGFSVITANSVADAFDQIQLSAPEEYAVVDMLFHDGCGLDVISFLKQQRPGVRAIILTGYGNIATAVGATKLGAVDYLLKPADADDIISALLAPRDGKAKAPSHPMSADRVRWEHIHHVYEVSGRNVSKTACRLNMHRRTLQRILTRRAECLDKFLVVAHWPGTCPGGNTTINHCT
jgi:two-component system response regulator RegA